MKQQKAHAKTRGSILLPSVMALCGLAVVALLEFTPGPNDRDVTAIFAPHLTFDHAAARVNEAGGAVLAVGSTQNIVIARFAERANYQALKDFGVWIILAADPPDICSGATKLAARNPNQTASS